MPKLSLATSYFSIFLAKYFKVIESVPGLYTKEDLKYLSGKDFRSCISSWASEHRSEQVSIRWCSISTEKPFSTNLSFFKKKGCPGGLGSEAGIF
jgi:hypothetical protein